jgi:hypothetical protein
MTDFDVNPAKQRAAYRGDAAIARHSARCATPVDFRRRSMSPIAS